MPLATTTPFSSTTGAAECHTSVSGRLIVSGEAPAFEASFLKVGQSAASSQAPVTRQHKASGAPNAVLFRHDRSLFIRTLRNGAPFKNVGSLTRGPAGSGVARSESERAR